jgi:AraC-like DNA-binding protein
MCAMFTSSEYPNLSYLCKLVHESLQLPVFCKTEGDLQEEWIWKTGLPMHPVISDAYAFFRSMITQEKDGIQSPVLHETNFMEQFIVVPVKRDGQRQAIIVIGPATRHIWSDSLCGKLLTDYGIPSEEWSKWTTYWGNLSYMNHLRLLHICVSVNWMMNQEMLEITDVFQSSMQYELDHQHKENELALAERREYAIFHSGKDEANLMLDLIRNGDKTELMKTLAQVTNESIQQAEGQSKKSYLRSVKNLAIGGITLSSHAAIEGGLNEEIAATLCELHVQHIEELNELSMIEAAAFGAFVDFADRVDQCRKSRSSKPIQACKEYIYLHLFEEIKLQQLSVVSGLNTSYLSQLFKKETGLTLTNYIQWERIEEAKKLLDHSNDTISMIAARLTFYDQAHFVKVFKKHSGLTPKQYRNRR